MDKYKCPICDQEFAVEFNELELNQGGKNDNCPSCKWLLWVPIRGDPMPVPIPIYQNSQFKEGEMPTEIWILRWKRNRNHRGQEIFYSRPKVFAAAAEKKKQGFKVFIKKLSHLERMG